MHAFASGLIAGYGIAIPVGAIAVLIVTKAARESFRSAAAAGLGAAADLTYAVVAVAAGAALIPYLRGATTAVHLVSGCVLGALAGYGILRAIHSSEAPTPDRPSALRSTYARFVGLTLINPLTVVYFTSLALATRTTTQPVDAAMFVSGVAIDSASWQTLLAGSGALLGRTPVARNRITTALIGNGIILALALKQFTALR